MTRPAASESVRAVPHRAFGWGLFGGTLLVAGPGLLAALALAFLPIIQGSWRWLLLITSGLLILLLAGLYVRRVLHPLHTLGNLLQALKEGDYSLRGVHDGSLGPVMFDVNALAQHLQRDRLRFEDASHLLSKTMEALDNAVFVFDETSRLQLINRAGQRLLGAESRALFGKQSDDLGLEALFAVPSGSVVDHPFPTHHARFEIRHSILRREGRSGRLLVANDVGHVLREEERQAWQRLLRVLGHEVNNSLAPIQSMADTLAVLVSREPPPEDWREDLQAGLDLIGRRTLGLTRFLAGYSKLTRLPVPQLSDTDFALLIRRVAKLETRVKVILEDSASLSVRIDSDQIEQAMINLLQNAAEAVAGTTGKVRISWHQEAGTAVVEIRDDGPGPPPSENLFVPFFTTKPGGSGIGLALARQIAEAHGGSVSLSPRNDAPGALARLWVKL